MVKRSFIALIVAISLITVSCSQEKSAEEYIQNGKSYFDKKEWKSAVIEFKNAIKQVPKNAQARALLGQTYLETFSTNAAIKEIIRARDLGYGEEKIIIPLGKAYAQDRDYKKIIEDIVIDKAYSDATQADIYALRAKAYLAIGNTDSAKQALDQAKQKDDSATDVRLAWALFEKQNGNVEAQKSWLKPLLEKDGGVADAWSQMGEIENAANNLEAAEKAYTRSIELRQYTHYDYARRALVRVARQNFKGAQADIDTLKKAGAKWPAVGHIDGVLAYQDKRYDEAQSHFQDVLSRAPQYGPSQYMLALIYFNNRSFQNAVALLEQYTANYPDQIQAEIIYVSSLVQLNQLDKALAVLDRLRGTSADDYRVLSLLGNVYMRQHQTDKAIKVLQQAIKLKPDQASSRMQLGATLIGNESTLTEGQQQLIKAIELNPELIQAELALFSSYIKEKRFTDARQLAQNLDKKHADNSQGANMIALTYLAEEQKEKAVTQLKDTLKRFPDDFLTSHNLARIYMQDKKLTEAKTLYENVLTKQPAHLQTLNQLALIAAREGDQAQMMLRLKQAEEGNPDQLSPKITLASQYLKQNKPGQAIEVLNGVKQEQKELPGYILLMAQAKLGINEQQHAIRLLKLLVSKNPEISAAHFLLARGYALEKKPAQMRQELQITLDLVPEHLQSNIVMARLDLSEGKFDDFKKRVAYLEKIHPGNADVEFLKAKAATGDQDYSGAITTLSSLMKQTPNSQVAIDLSRNQWQTGDKQGAIAGLELWLEGNAKDTPALMLLAQYYLADNRNEEGKAAYQKLVTQTENNPVVLNNLAWLLKDTDPEQGIEYAQKALKLKPDSALAQDTLAMLYLQINDKEKALEWSEKAAKAMPDFEEIQLNYAKVLVANNQKAKAKALLNALYTKTKSDKTKQLIRKELDNL